MFNLQLLNSQQHLFYLVRFSLSLMILYVDPRISLPRRLVNMVTSVFLSWLTEIINTDFAQVRKPDIRWIDFHPYEDIFDLGHGLYSINIDIYVKPYFAGRKIEIDTRRLSRYLTHQKREERMFKNRWAASGLVLFTLFFFISILEIDAWARVGGGRSFGSRGSRSFTAPRSTPAPAPVAPSQGAKQYGAPAAPAPASSPFGGGGFLRSMAGGLAGGMLGAMLFRSLGFAGGAGGTGSAGGTDGGIGMMDILLIGALLYGIYWFIKRRRRVQAAANAPGAYCREALATDPGLAAPAMQPYEPAPQESDIAAGLHHIRQMDPPFEEKSFTDGCLDLFFRIQGAWTNRDMTGVRNLLTDEMFTTFTGEAEQLRAKKRVNRLENIAVRAVEIMEIWQEKGEDFITVKVYANLLDYTVDEGSGEVLSGSKTEPVKFSEFWTFTRPVGDHPWKLSAINQVE
jgi:predicted lipid-binding transport protein (Tim44 family)